MRIQQTVDCLSGSMLSPAFGVEQETRRYRSLTMTLLEPVRRTRLDQVYYGPMERCSTWGRIPTLVHPAAPDRSEEHTSELQSLTNLVCRLLLEKKKLRD